MRQISLLEIINLVQSLVAFILTLPYLTLYYNYIIQKFKVNI